MARYVSDGVLDAGADRLRLDRRARELGDGTTGVLLSIAELVYAKQSYGTVRWVLAVPDGSAFRTPQGSRRRTMKTELVRVTRAYSLQHRVEVKVEFSWGATEVKPPMCSPMRSSEATETGSALRANRLRIIDAVMESSTQLVANRDGARPDPQKQTKLANLALLLKAAIEAQGRVGLMLNVQRADLDSVLALLPALQRPTISPLSDADWVAVNTIIEERTARDLIPRLKHARAHGIVEYPLNKIVL